MKKVVVITGATSGIGLAIARKFADNGDTVIGIARHEGGEDVLSEFYFADVTDEEHIARIFDEIAKKHGNIDILVNNAGYGMSGATELISIKDARAIFDVNVIGKIIVSKYALPLMPHGSKLFYMASSMAMHPVCFRALYGGSKSAVRSIAFAHRMECRDFGVDVCCICPGNVKTNFTASRIKVFETNERYGSRMQRATEKLDAHEDKRMPATKVADVVFAQSRRRRTKPQVIVGGKHKVLYFMTKLLPISLYLRFATKATGGGSARDNK